MPTVRRLRGDGRALPPDKASGTNATIQYD